MSLQRVEAPKAIPYRYRTNWRGRMILQVEVERFEFGVGWVREWRDAKLSDFPQFAAQATTVVVRESK